MMNCTIPGTNLKVVIKAVQTLAKVGDELHIEAKQEGLALTAVNMTKTVFGTFEFLPVFFSSYTPLSTTDSDLDNSFHVNMKAILNLFRSIKEKNVDFFSVSLARDATKINCRIKCRNGVVIGHELHLIDFDSVTVADASGVLDKSEIKTTAGDFDRIFNMFPQSDSETNIECTPTKCVVKNYNINTNSSAKIIRTEVKLQPGEFKSYKITTDTCLMFSVKPLKALVSFAKMFTLDVSVNFDVGGRPVVVGVNNPTFRSSFVIASLNPNGADVTQTVAVTCTAKKSTHNNNTDVTTEDQQILEEVNWDDEFSEALKKTTRDENGGGENPHNGIVRPTTPESPLMKRQKTVFSRCFEETFDVNKINVGGILAPNSDSESD